MPKAKLIIVGGIASVAIAGSLFEVNGDGLRGLLSLFESSNQTILVPYADKLAGGLPTVCNGLTKHVTKEPIVVGQAWTPEKCNREEARAVIEMQLVLAGCFKKAPPNQAVFDAASSHAWNFGPYATCGSGAMKAWNRGEWELGCKRIARGDDGKLVWSYVSKVVNGVKTYTLVDGLATRRDVEANYCAGGL
jgi:GH24 family phage-related lysozyme (muramidase)